MTLHAILLAALALTASGLIAAVMSSSAGVRAGSIGAAVACLLGAIASARFLIHGAPVSLARPWSAAMGSLHLGLDAISAFFLLCVFVVCGLAAVYAGGYFGVGHRSSRAMAFFNLLVAAMVLLLIARDGVLFLMAWEGMSLASFFLVTQEHEREEVRRAGLLYLIASHVGVVCLFLLFALLARQSGSFDFTALGASGAGGLCFVLAVVGFGTKAGFWPMHVWLPEAHPAAPSPVSAVMSGVMVKMGIYGLIRTLGFLGAPRGWWGLLLIGIGLASGIAGALQSLAQRDLKRALAYCTVENIGIIAAGVGIGVLGESCGRPYLALAGFAGALLHVLNHGLFKGLLFQSAGVVVKTTSTRDMDALGGLARRMPVTAGAFLLGSVAIAGLPPLNGFLGEWFLYRASLGYASSVPGLAAVALLAVVATLALMGGLAAAGFVRAYGIVFLGLPRTDIATRARDPQPAMRLSMIAAAALCLAIGLWPVGAVRLVVAPCRELLDAPIDLVALLGPLVSLTRTALVLLALVLVLALVRRALLAHRDVRQESTWGCGYAAPSPRMQYTSSSFAQPSLAPYSALLSRSGSQRGLAGWFPTAAHFDEQFGDPTSERLLFPAVGRIVRLLGRARALQQGHIQRYLLYILLTLVALLSWQLAWVGHGTP